VYFALSSWLLNELVGAAAVAVASSSLTGAFSSGGWGGREGGREDGSSASILLGLTQ